jgi:acyl transferase domain-containing protein
MSREPIAIVGMACRLPGAPDLAALWSLLVEGRVGLRPVPLERYDVDRPDGADRRGRPLPREGGFLDDVTDFDHGLFRLSAREAMSMDPQHRLLLEVAWSALQDAGLSREAVYGARAAVYVGLFTSDFRERMLRAKELDLDVYFEIGTTRSSAAGRISHAFHLQGPAGAVDAACASSLLSVHLAAQSLWSGESSLALAGGSNLLLEADTTICFHRSGMLSPRSRCHFGDADADGFVRSEGVGMVVLKRLSDALRDGDRVYAVIPSTAATNDGRSGDGLFMTPSVEGQELLLRQAYVEAGLDLRRVAFIEAHGTGTRAGDPVECTAIARVLGAGRDRPLPLGSIKTNIGHCEGAAGIAGLLKAALALHHRSLPGSLHLRSFNPDIPWEAGQLQIPQVATPLPAGPLLAGVNSFGLSGTDVHVVLGTAPERPIAEPPGPPVGG